MPQAMKFYALEISGGSVRTGCGAVPKAIAEAPIR
jgi:hypothetical protein